MFEKDRHTAEDRALKVLGQGLVRRTEGILELIEAAVVVLAFQVTLDGLQHLLNLLEAGIETGDLLLSCEFLLELEMAVLVLFALVANFADDVARSLVDKFDASSEVNKLVGPGLLLRLGLGSDWLLLLLLLLLWWLLLLLVVLLLGWWGCAGLSSL